MKKYTLKNICYIILIGGLSSCSTSYYASGVQRAPILQEKGELTAAASGSVYARSVSTDFHAAYSPIENIGVMVNGNLFSPQTNRNTFNNTRTYTGLEGQYMEAAGGYYQLVGENSSVEIYGGYGRLFDGSTTTSTFNNDFISSFDYNRFFIQTAFGYRGEIFEIAPSVRVSRIDFQNVRNQETTNLGLLVDGDNFIMFEPSLTVGLGFRYFKFQISVGSSFNFQYANFEYEPIALSAGFLFNLKPSYKKKAESKKDLFN